jgi:teichuronic acid biosynthesis glycosyltransferase TuaG
MNAEQPLVSVIIPNYNHGAFVGNAVRSVLGQTHKNLEVIVVDNFSTDDTLQMLAEIKDARLKVFQFNNRGIIAAGRNFGAKQASGEVLAFLDSDDTWLPEKLARQIPHLDDPVLSCVSSDFLAVGDARYHKQHLSFAPGVGYRDYQYDEIARRNAVMTSSAVLRTADFLAVGGFDENPDFRFIEDWELWLRMAHRGSIRVLNEQLIAYRIQRNKNRDMRYVSLRTLKVLRYHRRLGYINGVALETAYGSCYLLIAKAHLDQGDRRGIRFYRYGFFCAEGLWNKVRAAVGMTLFFTPAFMRHAVLEAYYRLPLGNPS